MKSFSTIEWSQVQIAALTRLWAEGHTAKVIGRQLNATRNAVLGKVHRLALPLRAKQIKDRKPRPVAPPKPIPEPIPEEVLEPCEPVTLTELESHHCHFPLWDQDIDFRYCGREATTERPYCKAHSRRMFVPIKKRERAA